jgi:hypothetical protein
MLLESLPPEQRTAIYAGAFLLYAREVSRWSPPPCSDEPTCRCPACASAKRPPHRGTEAARRAMHRRHALIRRGKR